MPVAAKMPSTAKFANALRRLNAAGEITKTQLGMLETHVSEPGRKMSNGRFKRLGFVRHPKGVHRAYGELGRKVGKLTGYQPKDFYTRAIAEFAGRDEDEFVIWRLHENFARAVEQLLGIERVPLTDRHTTSQEPGRGKRRGTDAARNRKVEKAAIKEAKKYYRAEGYDVESVESEQLGFDLKCKFRRDEHVLGVEVKGRSGQEVQFHLTRGEMRAIKAGQCQEIFVVINALSRRPRSRPWPSRWVLRNWDVKPDMFVVSAPMGTRFR